MDGFIRGAKREIQEVQADTDPIPGDPMNKPGRCVCTWKHLWGEEGEARWGFYKDLALHIPVSVFANILSLGVCRWGNQAPTKSDDFSPFTMR